MPKNETPKRTRGRQAGEAYGTKAGGRPAKGSGPRSKINITLDPDLALLVQWHAAARGISTSESINILVGEALRNHTVDTEAQEVH
jgi:hypothetical protein